LLLNIVKDLETIFNISINKNIINILRNRVFYKGRLSLLILKELRHRDKVERTYNWTVFNINKNKVNSLAFKTKNRNLNSINAFKANIATNITIVLIVTIYNVYKVRNSANSIISITSVKYLIILQR
jgi:hypothetical protein